MESLPDKTIWIVSNNPKLARMLYLNLVSLGKVTCMEPGFSVEEYHPGPDVIIAADSSESDQDQIIFNIQTWLPREKYNIPAIIITNRAYLVAPDIIAHFPFPFHLDDLVHTVQNTLHSRHVSSFTVLP